MFEVGKKYRHKYNLDDVCEVLFVGKERTFVRYNDGETTIDREHHDQYIEHKEPRKFVRYINMYDDYHGFETREQADIYDAASRIGCIRVELTEGQFDD